MRIGGALSPARSIPIAAMPWERVDPAISAIGLGLSMKIARVRLAGTSSPLWFGLTPRPGRAKWHRILLQGTR